MLPTTNQVTAFQQKIQNDPVYFVKEVLGNKVWEKEKEILEAVRDNAEVSVRSCHASGKTYTAARVIHWVLCAFPNSVVITTAPTFRQVKEILWREVKDAIIDKAIYPRSAILDTAINLNPKWFALGLSTDRPDQFQGFHSSKLLVVGDEASGITPEIYEAIDGLSPWKVLLIGNPLNNTGRFADTFKEKRVAKMHISAFDTPNVKQQRVIIPGLITMEDIKRIERYYGADSDVYRVRVLGEFPRIGIDTLFGVDDVNKAMENDCKVLPKWEKKMGVDVARFGDDRTVILIRQMEKVIRKDVFAGNNLMETTGQVLRIAKEEKVRKENINVDVIGVGGGVVDRLREQGWAVNAVNVAERAEDHENFGNKRAELFAGKLKEWMKTADIPKDDDFFELANIKYHFNSRGQMMIERKEDMKKRGLDSPDVADALALTFAGQATFVMPEQTEAKLGYYPELGI